MTFVRTELPSSTTKYKSLTNAQHLKSCWNETYNSISPTATMWIAPKKCQLIWGRPRSPFSTNLLTIWTLDAQPIRENDAKASRKKCNASKCEDETAQSAGRRPSKWSPLRSFRSSTILTKFLMTVHNLPSKICQKIDSSLDKTPSELLPLTYHF